MNLYLKLYCSASLISTILISNSFCQPGQKSTDTINLTDMGRVIENTISFKTSYINYQKIHATPGKKMNVSATMVRINSDTLDRLTINTRGQSSLNFRRKSFCFDLKSKATFHHGNRTESFKKFYLTSLSMDRNYISNRLAFEMLEEMHLFPLFYSYCQLWINGECEGIYMLIEPPEDWAMKMEESPLIIRRGFNHSIDKIKTGVATTSEEAKKNRDNFNLIYKSLNKYEGKQLYKVLSDLLDMDAYMNWIAFNFFVKNGDYTDEVFFYFDKDINKYNIIPWDYDDLFSPAPHEGEALSKKLNSDKLFFSTEDILDKKIVSDPYLYKIYLIHLRELLTQLSPDIIKKVLENTFAEVYPFYANSEIINKSAYDQYPRATLTKLKEELSNLYVKLLNYRDVYMKEIDGELK